MNHLDRWTVIVHEPHKFLLASDVPNHTPSSVLSGVESLMAKGDLVFVRYTPVGYHAQEYLLARLQHEYLQSVWDEFKSMGLLERKSVQEHEDRVMHVLNKINPGLEKANLAGIMRVRHSLRASQFRGTGYDDISPYL
jgi:hypothetical protein